MIVFLGTIILGCASAGCGDSSGSGRAATEAELTAKGPYAVATRDFTFVDTSRSTPANGTYPGAAERSLRTMVWYPTDASAGTGSGSPPVASGGPFPIIGYGHGFLSSRGEAAALKEHLASHGYIVAAPDFPLSNGGAPGGPTNADLPNQPGDLGFVLRSVKSLGGADADLGAAVDSSRQAIAGYSGGGATVLAGVYHPVLHLADIKAAVAYAPASCWFGKDFYVHSLPTLILGGDADEFVPFNSSEARVAEFAPSPLILARLIGGTHLGVIGVEAPDGINTDEAGCASVRAAGGTLAGLDLMVAGFRQGTSGSVIDLATCAPLCGQMFVQTMHGARQVELQKAATLAQFEAILRGRRDAQRYLDTVLGENPDVQVTVKR
jgi:predicted dienelactone hydrolase